MRHHRPIMRRRLVFITLLVLFITLFALVSLLLQAPWILPQGTLPVLALVGARVIPSPDAAPTDDASVVIERGRITAVGPREKVAIPAGSMTLDKGSTAFTDVR